MSWPVTDLDAIARLRVLAAATPGAVVAQTTLDAPFDAVWAVASDLEGELPRYLVDVRSMRITSRESDRLEADARGYLGLRARFDVVLRPGWCVMRSRFLLGGMAAVADGERTRFAFLGGTQVWLARPGAPLLRALGNWSGPRVLRRFAARVDARALPG